MLTSGISKESQRGRGRGDKISRTSHSRSRGVISRHVQVPLLKLARIRLSRRQTENFA